MNEINKSKVNNYRYDGERHARLVKLEAIFDSNEVSRLAKLAKSEYNTYGLVDELKRLGVIFSLACRGFSFLQIYEWVERQQEREIMFLLECGFNLREGVK